MSKMFHVEERVTEILCQIPESRDDDKLLFKEYLFRFHGIRTFNQYVKNNTPSIETIRRVRQKIQSNGFYLPLKENTRIRRMKTEQNYRDYALYA